MLSKHEAREKHNDGELCSTTQSKVGPFPGSVDLKVAEPSGGFHYGVRKKRKKKSATDNH